MTALGAWLINTRLTDFDALEAAAGIGAQGFVRDLETFLIKGDLGSWLVVLPLLIWGAWILSQESFDELNSRNLITAGLQKTLATVSKSKGTEIEFASWHSSRDIRKKFLPLFFALAVILFLVVGMTALNKAISWIYPFTLIALLLLFLSTVKSKAKNEKLKHSKEMESEIPAQIQLMAILISSGMSPTNAIATLSARSDSRSSQALREVVSDVENGHSIVSALDRFKFRFESSSLRRFSTSLILGIERGSSLTPILIAQVRDARLSSKSETMKKAGRAEIALMIPVVFLILPISILFALWPSYQQLGLFI